MQVDVAAALTFSTERSERAKHGKRWKSGWVTFWPYMVRDGNDMRDVRVKEREAAATFSLLSSP
jgi:hypothetical protein